METTIENIFAKKTLKPRSSHHRSSTYKPQTRLEKLRQKNMVFPQSTQTKIVFISNVQGNGFRRQDLSQFNVPQTIEIQKMIEQINKTCYLQWLESKYQIQKDPFQIIQTIIKIFYLVMLIIIFCMFMFTYSKQTDALIVSIYIILVTFVFGFITALVIYFSQRKQHNADKEMIKSIRNKLTQFNQQQVKKNIKPQFVWTCHFDCLWIAISIY